MKYQLYKTSAKTWDAMLSAIEQAQKSIYIEMYTFLDDTSESHDFIGKLKQKSSDGVKVIIVADAFGSSEFKKESMRDIKACSIEFIFYSHWLRHMHRKILIVDEKIAFIGGVNIAKRFIHWNDIQLKLHGGIVKTIVKSFAYTYGMSGGLNPKILAYRKKKFAPKLRFWLIEHWPVKNIYSLKSQYREQITKAKFSIQIVTTYFTPPRWLIALLDTAVRKNIKVEIIIPQKTDLPFIDRINHRYMYNLSKTGISFFLTHEMNHAKILIIDKEIGMVGSQNIDMLSFRLNTEAGVFFKNAHLIKELGQTIDEWKNKGEEFKPQKYKMRAIDYLILALMKLFRPIL